MAAHKKVSSVEERSSSKQESSKMTCSEMTCKEVVLEEKETPTVSVEERSSSKQESSKMTCVETPTVVEEAPVNVTVHTDVPACGEAYIVKCNKSLGIMLSKYSVRIKTQVGYKEIYKVARNKAYTIALNLNNSRDISRVIVEE